MAKIRTTAATKQTAAPKRTFFSQSDLPSCALVDALGVARALHDNYAGGPTAPHNAAIALSMSPTSSGWRMLAGAALAYGLTTGSFSADTISITPLARRILAPTADGDDASAFAEAALKPTIMKRFFERFDKSKFPKDEIAKNILVEMGVPRDRVDQYLVIIQVNGREARVIQDTTSGPFVAVAQRAPLATPRMEVPEPRESESKAELPPSLQSLVAQPASRAISNEPWDKAVRKVFISHGKNKKILEQVKEIVRYGKFEPIVAAERETVSKPVPDKVMDDMRSCQAAVIHVASEGALVGADGTLHPQINENVLIEIGAAMALYRRRFVLLEPDSKG